MYHRVGLGIAQWGQSARHVLQHLYEYAAQSAKRHVAESRLVFRADKQLGALQHLLYHHARSALYLHHAVKLQCQVFGCAYVQRHAAHVALVYRAYHLSHHGESHALGKGRQLLFVLRHQLGHQRYAGAR